MKIGVNATFLNEKPTGVGVYAREVSTHLSTMNRETLVFTSVPESLSPAIRTLRTPALVKGSRERLGNILRFLYLNTLLPLRMKTASVDVLFCPIAEFPSFSPVPVVVTVHDLHPVYFPEQFGLAAAHFRLSLRLLPRTVRRVTVPSDFVKRELLKFSRFNSERIDVIPNGYDSERFKSADPALRNDFLLRHGIRGPYILFVGSLFPYKNIASLVSAFLEIKDTVPHSLVVAGKKEVSSGPLVEDERILYLDYVAHDEIPAFYTYADILVHPSLVEGFGMTVIEAMACGTPVVSSNRGSLQEVAGDAAILVDPQNTTALADAILSVLKHERLRNELREKGFRNIRRFSWRKTAEGILLSCEKAITPKT